MRRDKPDAVTRMFRKKGNGAIFAKGTSNICQLHYDQGDD
jgi:hypothetical protein